MAIKLEGLAVDGAKAVYDRLKNDRQPYEKRAEDCAALTIPSLFPKSSDDGSTNYATPYQSVGARGLNNLASKLMLASFPINTPFFRLNISEYEAKTLAANPEELQKVDEGLSMVERVVINYMEANNYRVTLFELIKQLIVAGNGLLYIPQTEGATEGYQPMRLYRLSSFVVERDAYGNVLQLVTMDKIAFAALPEDLKSKVPNADTFEPNSELEVYTHVYLDEESGDYLSYQEIEGEPVEGTEGSYPKGAVPWIPVRLIRIDGEDYGRSFCEEYLGDLRSLEMIQKAMVDMSAIAAKVLFLVNPNGITQPRRLVKANNGDFVAGRKQDVEVFQLEKYNDFNTAKSVADTIEARLSYAFMLNSAVQRNGERVTAEEIRYVASELEDTLGGVYSMLTQELQMPLVSVLLVRLQATSKIPDLPKEAIEPSIATGMEALGRGHDLDKLTQFLQAIQMIGGMNDPDLDITNLKLRVANSLGIDTAGLLKTPEQKAQEAAQQGLAAGAQQGGAVAGANIANAATADPAAVQQAMAGGA